MATLVLTQVFIHHMASGAYVSAQAARDRQRKIAQDVNVRTYGLGRRRAITQVGRINTLAVNLRLVPELAMVSLETWIGDQVLYRDDRGRRFACVYDGLDYKEYVDSKTTYDLGFTIQEVTWPGEGVS